MRTTVTLDDDVYALLERAMKTERVAFKEALNSALRRGLMTPPARRRARPKVRVFDTGPARVAFDDVAGALAIAEGEDFR